MFIKRDKIYSDAYKYLRSKDGKMVAFQLPSTADVDNFEEQDIDLDTVTHDKEFVRLNGNLLIKCNDFSYSGIKTAVISSRYSNDDQIAIMLNDEKDEIDNMQAWREFAKDIARRLT